jgi:hypothetical protein
MNALQDGRIQLPRYGNLRHLEGDVARTRHHLGADLDQFLPERGQRPVTHGKGKRKPTKKVSKVVGQGKQLKPNLIVVEVMTGQPGPLQRIVDPPNETVG